MYRLHLLNRPNRRIRTRTYGGVTGKTREGLPMSISHDAPSGEGRAASRVSAAIGMEIRCSHETRSRGFPAPYAAGREAQPRGSGGHRLLHVNPHPLASRARGAAGS